MHDHPGGDKIRPYFERLIRLCAEAGAEAIANLAPAWLTFGSGTCDLAQNRDAWDEDSQQFVTGFNPDGEADDTVLVARATADDGSVLATLVNYGCHPTTLGPTNRLLSPDYIGAMREVVEDSFGAPCLFLLSPCGETGPREGFVGDTAVADSNGRRLGFAAAGAVESRAVRGDATRIRRPHHLRRHPRRVEANASSIRPQTTDHSCCAAALCASTCRSSLTNHRPTSRLRHEQATRDLEAAQASGDPIAIRDATALRERARRRLLRGPDPPQRRHHPVRSLPLADRRRLPPGRAGRALLLPSKTSYVPASPTAPSSSPSSPTAPSPTCCPATSTARTSTRTGSPSRDPAGMELVLQLATAAIADSD